MLTHRSIQYPLQDLKRKTKLSVISGTKHGGFRYINLKNLMICKKGPLLGFISVNFIKSVTRGSSLKGGMGGGKFIFQNSQKKKSGFFYIQWNFLRKCGKTQISTKLCFFYFFFDGSTGYYIESDFLLGLEKGIIGLYYYYYRIHNSISTKNDFNIIL